MILICDSCLDASSITARATLNDGNAIPVFGLGVYESAAGAETYNSVKWALEAGYRHVDSAEWYENEQDTGRAIRDFIKERGVPREDIFYSERAPKDVSSLRFVAQILLAFSYQADAQPEGP